MNLYICVCPKCYKDLQEGPGWESVIELVAAPTPGRAKALAHGHQPWRYYSGEYIDWRARVMEKDRDIAEGVLRPWPERYQEGLGPKSEQWLDKYF